jgi:hypothetical protein
VKYHRFPKGEGWTISRVQAGAAEVVTVEGDFRSASAIGTDYVRTRHPRAHPAHNEVSFALENTGSATLYEYSEAFVDPASPTAAARQLARALLKRDSPFARELVQRIEAPHIKKSDVRRVYRDDFALPLLRAATALAARRAYGLRERQQLQALFQEDRFGPALAAGLLGLLPGADPAQVRTASDASLEALMPGLESEMAAAGLPMDALFPDLQETRAPIHFTARLVMPAPITRANTCVNGDTATWEFEGDDLYGRGFEMWARAAAGP